MQSPKGKRERSRTKRSRVSASGTDKPGPESRRFREHVRPQSHTAQHAFRWLRSSSGLAPEGAVGYRLVLPTRTPMMSLCLRPSMRLALRVTIPFLRFRLLLTFD